MISCNRGLCNPSSHPYRYPSRRGIHDQSRCTWLGSCGGNLDPCSRLCRHDRCLCRLQAGAAQVHESEGSWTLATPQTSYNPAEGATCMYALTKAKLASLLFPALRVAVVDRAVDSCRQARDVSHLRFAEAFEMKYGLRACRRAMGRNASAASSHGVAAGIGHLGHLRIKVGGVAFLPWCSNPSFPVVHREVTESPCLVVFSLVDPRVKADLHFRASFAWDSDSSIDEARGATLPSPGPTDPVVQ